MADLKNYVGGVGINTLVDLTISCDFAIKQQVQVFCKQQQDLRGGAWVQVRPPHLHLQPLWTRDTLCNLLQGAMHAISKGKTVMLPQGDVYERALLFIWNALPPRDHPNVPWSTNFYSGAGFRLANNPQSLQEQPQQNVTMLRTPPRPPWVWHQDLAEWAERAPLAIKNLVSRYVPINAADLQNPPYQADIEILRLGLWQHQHSIMGDEKQQRLQWWLNFLSFESHTETTFYSGAGKANAYTNDSHDCDCNLYEHKDTTQGVLTTFMCYGTTTVHKLQHLLDTLAAAGLG